MAASCCSSTSTLSGSLSFLSSSSVVAQRRGSPPGDGLRRRPDASSEPIGVVQGALLGLVGLLLAFGLTMAVGRYEARRALVVQEANTIGTTYLPRPVAPRADALQVARTLEGLWGHRHRPGQSGAVHRPVRHRCRGIRRHPARTLGTTRQAVPSRPRTATGTGPLTYIPSLNEMIDTHSERIASLPDARADLRDAVAGRRERHRNRRACRVSGAARSKRSHGADRCRFRDCDPVRLVRSRSARARVHHGAVPPRSWRHVLKWISRRQPARNGTAQTTSRALRSGAVSETGTRRTWWSWWRRSSSSARWW